MNNPLKSRPLLLLLLIAFVGVILLVLSPLMKDGQKEKDQLPEKQETLAAFLEQTQGVGEVHLKLCADENGRIVGAAVLCQGGDDPLVASKVTRLLSAALGLPTNKIEVCATKE